MASGLTPTYGIPYPLLTDGVDVSGDIESLAIVVEGILLTKSNINSPTFSGTPLLSTTPPIDDNTEKIASTAFVIGQASETTPVMDGVATIGSSLRYARANHIHPSDTTKANLSGATFTGNVIVNSSASFSSNVNFLSTINVLENLSATSASFSNLINGESAIFTGFVSGIYPTNDDHFATKEYVDSNINSFFLMGG